MTSSSSYSKFPKSVWLSSHLCRDWAIENGTDEYAMEKNSHLITTIHHIKSEHLASSAALCFTSARYNYLQLIWLIDTRD